MNVMMMITICARTPNKKGHDDKIRIGKRKTSKRMTTVRAQREHEKEKGARLEKDMKQFIVFAFERKLGSKTAER